MDEQALLIFLANTILVIHAAFVAFVVLALAAISAGYFLGWRWVRNRSFRIAHLVAIALVVAQSWAGVICPLTVLEMGLRSRAGSQAYSGSFIQYWLQKLIYYEAPDWVFIMAYTVFAALVVIAWYVVAPEKRDR